MKTRLKIITLLLRSATAIAFASAVTAFAQTSVSVNKEIPQMLVRLCPTLSEAQTEASIAHRLGQGPMPQSEQLFQRNNNCHLDYATVTPLREETDIQPFSAWTINYDENSPDSVRAPSLSSTARIKVSARRGQVRYYYSTFITSEGERLSGWAEIPDSPYILVYLNEQKKASSK
jgi:hypothetical protein